MNVTFIAMAASLLLAQPAKAEASAQTRVVD
jgi:hypothetical protein